MASDVDDPPPISLRETSSPFEPPEVDDRTYVINEGPGLDTGCSFRSEGPLVFNVPVTRYAGPTNADGTLQNAAQLVQRGLIGRYATLIMPAYDVDFDAVTTPPEQPERDRVFFNGESVKVLFSGNSEYLQGANNIWRLNSFLIPIEKVKFPSAPGTGGNAPTPAQNEIRIDIDVANIGVGELWCTAIDWAALKNKIMSPIILIRGNGSNGGFFARRGFTTGLDNQFLLWDNSISMVPSTNTRAKNGLLLNQRIPEVVTSFGVDSVHLVVHSKGGLDTREYLEVFQPAHNATFEVLSYTSLSSPHNGSVLADVAMTRKAAAGRASYIQFSGFPGTANALTYLAKTDDGTDDLQTTKCAAFNRGNLAALPKGIVYNTVAADADLNSNTVIDFTPDEYAELRAESVELTRLHGIYWRLSRNVVDTMYQILRNTSGVTVAYTRTVVMIGGYPVTVTVATLTAVPNPAPLGNDTMVTIPSGHGTGSFAALTTNTATFTGAAGRNHSSVANVGVAATVGPWIIATEKARGDLK
ncbi:MAG: hypothetical protein KAY37_10305 [Phycisphaerae bacterium]|nr:hypothetical protein [Phycisphaerae bacterium]